MNRRIETVLVIVLCGVLPACGGASSSAGGSTAGAGSSDSTQGSGSSESTEGTGSADAPTGPVRLTTGFTALTRAGTTNGTEPSGACEGFFPATPNLQMVLEAPMVGLAVRAESESDVALLIALSGTQSKFCGAPEADGPTVARGSWSAGTYDLYVGVPADDGNAAFTLRFIETR